MRLPRRCGLQGSSTVWMLLALWEPARQLTSVNLYVVQGSRSGHTTVMDVGSCECAAGQKPGAENCSCLIEISCLDGFEVIDTNDDGCGDTCAQPCKATCDCYKDAQPQNQSCVFVSPAQNQGVLWVCDQGYCQEECGTYTDEHFKCVGCVDPVTTCPDGETPTDTTGDGCPDSCPSQVPSM